VFRVISFVVCTIWLSVGLKGSGGEEGFKSTINRQVASFYFNVEHCFCVGFDRLAGHYIAIIMVVGSLSEAMMVQSFSSRW
jgi:hypothetical protein